MLPGAPRDGTTTTAPALLEALARAFQWRRLLDYGQYGSISDSARAKEIDPTYVGDILRLTLLAPEIVEGIAKGRQPTDMTLPALMGRFQVEWVMQLAR